MPTEPELQPRLRFSLAGSPAFGPGKADLLTYITATGSIRTAAAELAMSYQRAWTLVREMNGLFREPPVVVKRGGGTGGGATLKDAGESALARCRRMEAACRRATEDDWQALCAMINPPAQ